MCGRFVITSAPAALRQLFGYVEQPNFPPRYNVAPTQPIPVVLVENGARHFRLMRWGLLPGWVKDPKSFTLLINARSETILEKPAFKRAIRRRRGLIPADGYYEWKVEDGRKQPFFIHRADGAPLGFAAVFETWAGPNGEELDTVAIVTAAAGEDLAALHDRVPVTIGERDVERWLDIKGDDVDSILPLLAAPRIGEFAWHPVSTRVNRVANDDEQLLLPVSAEEMAAEAEAAKPKKAARKVTAASSDDGQGSLF
ncbi:SOS response-associated peptidase [Bradyrhizobium sp. CCBAU 53351]|uniref:SOS response-associated peptidase n=1 Tax=Bradyrhizobium sp. CCBAU 53351 TaxID=1325114 RepID=UPI0018877342|nr:SOS response-associated peptidase [Bradyrhizobium sp. CCBAU 53351]QOZ75593.1 SOS response-associated peptidase [Bradyrhizobium sp. CCBAU 53351]